MTQMCSTCRRTLSKTDFNKNKSTISGLSYRCKDCTKAFYQANREKIIEKSKKYAAEHLLEKAEYDKARRAIKGDELRAHDRERNKLPHRVENSLRWQRENPEKRKVIVSRSQKKHWDKIYKKHKAVFLSNSALTRARKNKRLASWFGEWDEMVMDEACKLSVLRSEVVGCGEWQVDHIIPMKCKIASGLHVAENLHVVSAVYNRNKSSKYGEKLPFGLSQFN